ncbi:MAG: amidohydrolase family protein [Rubripirellula sp.]
MKRFLVFALFSAFIGTVLMSPNVAAQQSTSTSPVVGLRSADASPILLRGGDVVSEPGQDPARMDVLIQGNVIVRVAAAIDPSPGTQIIDITGQRVYAGLIDAMHDVELPRHGGDDPAGYWNANVTPQDQAASASTLAANDLKKHRDQGITAQLLAPKDGIIKGTSCVVLMVDPKGPQRLLRDHVFQHATLTVPRGSNRGRNPNSPMGATALFRQSLYDTIWYRDAVHAYGLRDDLPRPEHNVALEALARVFESQPLVIDAANERMAIRAADVCDEFSVSLIVRGSGREYRAIDEIANRVSTVLVPVDFPDTPSVATAESIRETPLVDWMHWRLAPENPAKLNDAGVEFCLTTDGLDDPGQFLKNVRVAVARGLNSAVAHASMTTTPARLLGIEDQVGRVRAGMLANLVVTDGDLFGEKTKVMDTWVAGQRFPVDSESSQPDDSLIGQWQLNLPAKEGSVPATLVVRKKGKGLAAKLRVEVDDESDKKKDDDEEEPKSVEIELANLIRQRERFSASVELASFKDDLGSRFIDGLSRLTLVTIEPAESDSKEPAIFATLVGPDGVSRNLKLKRIVKVEKEKEKEGEDEKDKEPSEHEDSDDSGDPPKASTESIAVRYPLGAFGLSEPPALHGLVLFRDATVWTCGPLGKLERGDVLVKDGKIVDVGTDLKAPAGAHIVDAKGKHITPGLIDCHSHAATDGGINESGQDITAEVRIGDFIDNSDISIYRQLAGGVTTANVLHGSANPIGGQSQTIKFRWGETMSRMKFSGAPAGIKFALGENVKRTESRYPNTRMGVEQILRDQFLAARQYDAAWKAWEAGDRSSLPPRRDLQLDALVEIQQGDRWVHCHSYRQDEIVATLDVLEEFNVQIGTLQHILEGYKVADRIASHGAMASSFADWWAYKFEVFDAIPYNGVLLHNAGVTVSFNSDDAELARHLNTEAAKATKYGGVPEQEALKFVTLNPAKQLRIDDRVGSIEVGKDADLVIWSGRPLSTTTRCEQTWIDGRQYFSIDTDKKMRERDQKMLTELIRLATSKDVSDKNEKEASDEKIDENKDQEPDEEDRWFRFDVFCNAGQDRGNNQ